MPFFAFCALFAAFSRYGPKKGPFSPGFLGGGAENPVIYSVLLRVSGRGPRIRGGCDTNLEFFGLRFGVINFKHAGACTARSSKRAGGAPCNRPLAPRWLRCHWRAAPLPGPRVRSAWRPGPARALLKKKGVFLKR